MVFSCRPLIACLSLAVLAMVSACATAPEPSRPGVPETREVPLLRPAEPTPREERRRQIEGPAVIGFLAPLSGERAEVGQALFNAAQMALFRSGDDQIVLRPYDTQGRADLAERAAARAVEDGAAIILGPLFSASVAAAGPVARERRVPLIAFSNDRSVAGDGIYLLSFLPSEQVHRIVGYTAANGVERFAALVPDTDYGGTVLGAFQEAARWNGVAIADVEIYPPDTESLFAPVRRLADYEARQRRLEAERRSLEALGPDDPLARDALKRLETIDAIGDVSFDALLVPEGGAILRTLAPLLPYFDIDPQRVQFLGTGLWDDPGLRHEPALHGGWFAGPDPAPVRDLFARYEALFGAEPPRIATLSYDAVLLANALLATREGRRNPYGFLNGDEGFTGIDGLFRFRPDGTAERGLAVIEITPSGVAVIDPPPGNFRGFDPQRRGARRGPYSGPGALGQEPADDALFY